MKKETVKTHDAPDSATPSQQSAQASSPKPVRPEPAQSKPRDGYCAIPAVKAYERYAAKVESSDSER